MYPLVSKNALYFRFDNSMQPNSSYLRFQKYAIRLLYKCVLDAVLGEVD